MVETLGQQISPEEMLKFRIEAYSSQAAVLKISKSGVKPPFAIPPDNFQNLANGVREALPENLKWIAKLSQELWGDNSEESLKTFLGRMPKNLHLSNLQKDLTELHRIAKSMKSE